MAERRCSRCGETKPGDAFPRSTNPGAWCKACGAARQRELRRERREQDPAAMSARDKRYRHERRARADGRRAMHYERIKQKYGLDRPAYDALVLEHEGRCGICDVGTPDLVVDHCHDTGAVRGLLCPRCNYALGALGDTAEGVANALAYLLCAEQGRLTAHIG